MNYNYFKEAKNNWALAVAYLINYHNVGLSMKEPCGDMFYKFQSRLLEVEKGRKDKMKIRRLSMTDKNRHKHTMTYTHYKPLCNKKYLINLFLKLNKLGIKAIQH